MLSWFRKKQEAPSPPPPPPAIPFVATSIGATVDSFYRSAMNSLLNASLTNNRASFFPNMHIQTPIRVIYLNGIKNLRVYLDREKNEWIAQGHDATLVRSATAIAPGVLMTPFSSLLEASNAGHMNPESMAVRWTRGLAPRAIREVVFALGLNQVADTCQEKVPAEVSSNPAVRSALGSLSAGAMAGYLSHVPHNLSSLKLLKPTISYGDHFRQLMQTALESRFGKQEGGSWVYGSPMTRQVVGTGLVFFLPRGVMIRTMQIMGSFVLVNGTIVLLAGKDLDRRAVEYGRRLLTPPKPAASGTPTLNAA